MPTDQQPIVVIAAAGRARRFAGEQKVLANVGGRPAICRVAAACEEALGPHQQLIIIGHHGDRVRTALGEGPCRSYISQGTQLGTGHALATAIRHLDPVPSRHVYFLCGDKPLLSVDSLKHLGEELDATGAAMVFLTGSVQGDPVASRQGRVLQSCAGTPQAEVLGIVERATINALSEGGSLAFSSRTGRPCRYCRDDLLAVCTVNLSGYVWREGPLREHLTELPLRPEKGEYFVTDLVEILRRHQLLVRAVNVQNDLEGLGIDTPQQLVAAREAWQALQPSSSSASRSGLAARIPYDKEGDSGRR